MLLVLLVVLLLLLQRQEVHLLQDNELLVRMVQHMHFLDEVLQRILILLTFHLLFPQLVRVVELVVTLVMVMVVEVLVLVLYRIVKVL